MTDENKELQKEVKGWAVIQKNRMVTRVLTLQLKDKVALKKRVAHMNKEEYKPLAGSLGFGLKLEFGFVRRVNFRFSKQGIFFEHGVGRGRLRGSAQATPHPFLAAVLDKGIDQLADIIANADADALVGEIKFFIPGIIDRRIKITNNG